MKTCKCLFKLLLSISLITLLIPFQNIQAADTPVIQPPNVLLNEEELTPRSATGAVLVFVAGILVAQLVDGVLIHETGQSGAEWVADFMTWTESHRDAERVYMEKSGNNYVVRRYLTASGNECVKAPSGSGYVCKYSL